MASFLIKSSKPITIFPTDCTTKQKNLEDVNRCDKVSNLVAGGTTRIWTTMRGGLARGEGTRWMHLGLGFGFTYASENLHMHLVMGLGFEFTYASGFEFELTYASEN